MQIKKEKINFFRLVALIIAVLIICSVFTACGSEKNKIGAYKTVNTSLIDTGVLSSNSDYELSWDKDAAAVLFKSKTTGVIWSDILYQNFLEGSTSANGNSSILITVYNTNTLKTTSLRSYSEISAGNASVISRKIDNGVRVSYFFDKYEIAIPVDYILRDDSLEISIDTAKILEASDTYKLVSISLAPFMCSVRNDAENGNILIPTGSGAVMKSAVVVDGVKKYKGEVYGADAAREVVESFADDEAIKMPVFGASGGGNGIFGIIEEGAGSAEIEAQAGNEMLGYSNAYATFYVRGYDLYFIDSNVGAGEITTRYTDDISGQRFAVGYYSLYGEEANIGGMAAKYREYLTENNLLNKNETAGSPFSTTLLGATNIIKSFFGIPYKELVSLTTFTQAKEILEDIKKTVGVVPTVRLLGYGDTGVRPGSIAGGKGYSDIFGKKSDMKALEEFCEKENTKIYVDSEIVKFANSGAGFSLNADTARTAISNRITHYSLTPTRLPDEEKAYNILSRTKLLGAVELAMDNAKKYGNKSIAFSSIGSTAFSDYIKDEYSNKGNIEKDIASLFNKVKKNGYSVATANANSYAASAADLIFDAPTQNGGYKAFDEVVPFYQMVFHSYKPIYTDAANLAVTPKETVAKAVAFGMGIGFTLTDGYVDQSIDLDEYKLYGTIYEDNREVIKDCLIDNGFVDIYKKTSNSILEDYILLENGVSISIFANGVKVYTNHNSEPANSPIGQLDAYEFIME